LSNAFENKTLFLAAKRMFIFVYCQEKLSTNRDSLKIEPHSSTVNRQSGINSIEIAIDHLPWIFGNLFFGG